MVRWNAGTEHVRLGAMVVRRNGRSLNRTVKRADKLCYTSAVNTDTQQRTIR
jgi:hypothetical protein